MIKKIDIVIGSFIHNLTHIKLSQILLIVIFNSDTAVKVTKQAWSEYWGRLLASSLALAP